jgi:hypothetical protein
MGSLSQSNGYKGPALVILDRSRGSTEVARVTYCEESHVLRNICDLVMPQCTHA